MPRTKSVIKTSVLLAFICLLTSRSSRADDWPQWRGPRRDGSWNETGLIDKFSGSKLPLRWSVEIGAGYSGPTVAAGRVFVTDRITKPKQIERVLCFDAKNGKKIWSHQYPCGYGKIGYKAGPRAAVTVDGQRVYALGATGRLHCLSADKGDVIWEADLKKTYDIQMPIWGISAAPLIFGDLIILHIGGEGACVVALDKTNGKQRWTALDDRASYTAPVLVKQGKQDVVICWTGDTVTGLNPRTGDVFWSIPFKPRNMPIGIATPIVDKNRMFLTSFYDGCWLLRLSSQKPAAEVLWKRRGESETKTDGLHSIISTPIFQGQHIYGVDSYGELRCLSIKDGARVWEDRSATPRARWSTIHFVQNRDRVWMFNEAGDLIIAKLSPKGFEELSRAHLIDRTRDQLNRRGGVCWAHPAFANRSVYARNDNKLVCASLAK